MDNKKYYKQVFLFEHQQKFVDSKKQFPLLVGGLGSGKTDAGIVRAIKLILENRNTLKEKGYKYKFAIYMPNYSYFRLQIIPQFELKFPKFGITNYNINKSEFVIQIDNYAEIIMKSMDNPKTLVSYEVMDSWVDELDTMTKAKAEESFNKIKQRNRGVKINNQLNTVSCTSTPDGGTLGFLYENWVKKPEKNPNLLKTHEVIHGLTKNNIFLPKDYLMSAFGGLTFEKYRQMGCGEFIDVTAMPVYSRYNQYLCESTREWNGEELHIGMDFNINQMSAVVAIKDGEELHIVDEIVSNSFNKENLRDTPEMIQEIKHRYPNQNITIYPDAAGNQRNSTNYNTTNVTLLKEHFEVKLNYKNSESRPVNPSIEESVQVVNQAFKVKLFVNSDNCPNLVKNLKSQQYVSKDGKFIPDKSKGEDHMLDALRYLSFYVFKRKTEQLRDLSKVARKRI